MYIADCTQHYSTCMCVEDMYIHNNAIHKYRYIMYIDLHMHIRTYVIFQVEASSEVEVGSSSLSFKTGSSVLCIE